MTDNPQAMVLPSTPQWVPLAILVGTISFNPLLAVINANITPLGAAPVAAAELLLVAAAHIYALARFRPEMQVWYALIAVLVAFSVYRNLGVEGPSVRYLRDVLIIPTFVLLGLSISRATAISGFIIMHTIICLFALIEAFKLGFYSEIFDVRSYYINTRGVDVEQFTTEGSDLYVSAMRPEARFFDIVDLHRVSSIFLEPVSLGNYTIIATVLLTAWAGVFRPHTLLILAASVFLLMVACDGRLAFVSTIIILATAIVTRGLPRNIPLLYPPLLMLLMSLAVGYFGLRSGIDDFAGRIAYSVELLSALSLTDWLGLSDRLIARAVDAGFAYMILSQSLAGAIVLWIFIVVGLPERSMAERRLKQGICLYLVLTMTVSFSFLTIKTAGLLWVAYGAMIRPNEEPA